MKKALLYSAWAAGALLVACEETAPNDQGPAVRDSAGIQIVENALVSVPSMILSRSPMLEIGSESDSVAALYLVEGVARLTDGRIAVANRGSHEIRFFDEAGSFLHAVGRQGAGPGEYEYMVWMTTCGSDSLYVYDIDTRRLTVLDDRGETVRLNSLMLPDNILPYGAASCQPGGPFVTTGWAQRVRAAGLHRPLQPVGLAALDGSPLHLLGQYPGDDRWGWTASETGPLPLGRSLSVAIAADRVFVGTGDAYEIQVLSLQGELRSLIRLDLPRVPITASEIETYVNGRLAAVTDPAQRARSRRTYDDIEFLPQFPAYAQLHMGSLGYLWVQDYPRPSSEDVVWRRFTVEGEYVGQVVIPKSWQVFEIGASYVLVVVHDDLEVEYVRMYGLETA